MNLQDILERYAPSSETMTKGISDSALSSVQGLVRLLDTAGRSAEENLGSLGSVRMRPDKKPAWTDVIPLVPQVMGKYEYRTPEETKKTGLGTAKLAEDIEDRKFNQKPEVDWQKVKDDPLLGPRWVVEQGAATLPQMAHGLLNLPTFALSLWGNMAHERARNQDRKLATGGDMLATLPGAIANAVLMKTTGKATFGLGGVPKNFFKDILKSGAIGGASMGGFNLIDYLSTTIDTKKGKVTVADALDNWAQGAVLGGAMGAGARGTSRVSKKSGSVWREKVGDPVFKKLASLPPFKYWEGHPIPETERFLDTLYEHQGQRHRDAEMVQSIFDHISKLDEGNAKSVMAFLETRNLDPKVLPAKERVVGIELKQLFNSLGEKMAERGIIPEKSVAEYRDRYLPRIYKEFLKDYAHANQGPTLNLGPTKKRNSFLTEQQKRHELHQIDDPALRVAYGLMAGLHNVHTFDFQKRLAENKQWTLPESRVEVPGPVNMREVARSHLQALGQIAEAANPLNRGFRPDIPALPTQLFDTVLRKARELHEKFSDPNHPDFSMEGARDVWEQHIKDLRALSKEAPPEVAKLIDHEIDRFRAAMPRKMTFEQASDLERKLRNPEDDAYNQQRADVVSEILKDSPNPLLSEREKRRQWKQMPEGKQWGPLAGRYVRKGIYRELMGNQDIIGRGAINDAYKVMRNVMGYWKVGKVPFNPPTVFRNAWSNAILFNLSGTPLVKVPNLVTRALGEINTNGKYWREFKNMGAKNTTVAHAEFIEVSKMWDKAKAQEGGVPAKLGYLAKSVAGGAGEFYQGVELAFKTAKYIEQREAGKSIQDANRAAQKTFFDYQRVPKAVRILRQTPVAPFATFSFKAVPRVIESMIKHPVKAGLWGWAIYGGIAQTLGQAFAGLTSDEIDAIKKASFKYIRENPSAIMMPFKDKHGRWQFIDLTYIVPWGGLTKTIQGVIQGRPDFGEVGISSPALDIFNVLANWNREARHPFTNRKLWDRDTPLPDKISALGGYLYDTLMPTPLTRGGVPNKFIEKAQDRRNPYSGKESYTWEQLLPRPFGVNVYPSDPSESRRVQIRSFNYRLRTLRSERTREIRKARKMWSGRPERLREQIRDIRNEYREKINDVREQMRTFRNETRGLPR